MSWAFSVNVLGFFEKRLARSTPYESRNLAFGRAMGGPRGKILSLRSRIVGGFASLRFAPHIRLSSDLKFFPGDPPLNLDWEIFCHKIGDNIGQS
jgi:hypothetical protein